jgi:ribosomal protein S18 acetylase RimI-like enzyme
MATMTIRRAASGDEAALLPLATRLTEGVAPWRPEPGVVAAVVGWVEASLDTMNEPGHAVLVAEVEGRIVGFVTLSAGHHWSGETDASIGELVVAPEAEGAGVGTALVEAVIGHARDEGYTRVSVSTGAANARALRLYRRLGFEDEDISLSRPLP